MGGVMTPEPRERVDDFLRLLVGDPRPSSDDRAQALAPLDAVIHRRSGKTRRGWRLALAGALVVVVTVGALVLVDVWGTSSATAAMEEIARALEEVSPMSIDDTEFIHNVTESVALGGGDAEMLGDVEYDEEFIFYLLPRTIEMWRGASGSLQLRETGGEPIFFSPEAETAYYEADLDDIDLVGQTNTMAFTDDQGEEWPAGRDQLDAAIRDVMYTEREVPETVLYLDVALDILRDTSQPTDVRGPALRLIGELDGLDLVESGLDESTFSVDYQENGVDSRLTFTVGDDGHLRYEEILNLTADEEIGIPPNTAIYRASYSTPEVVDSLD